MSSLAELYQIWSHSYDTDSKLNPATEIDQKLLLRIINPQKQDSILDIGCGTGRLTIPLSIKCKNIIGIDQSLEMLRVAQEKSKGIGNIHYTRSDIRRKLPFKDRTFDSAVCFLVLSHIKNLNLLFSEVNRVLKKGGYFIYNDFAADLKHPFKTMYNDHLHRQRKKTKAAFIPHTLNEHVYALHRNNFEIEDILFTKVDANIKHTITSSSYLKNKGRTFGVIIKARKI
jgi:ubiquinone/menaquinone biosynthesis C-methylase UbiE